ncbi:hypothetical protein BJX70DRAFT_356281 [Aspergillus crustosus]
MLRRLSCTGLCRLVMQLTLRLHRGSVSKESRLLNLDILTKAFKTAVAYIEPAARPQEWLHAHALLVSLSLTAVMPEMLSFVAGDNSKSPMGLKNLPTRETRRYEQGQVDTCSNCRIDLPRHVQRQKLEQVDFPSRIF